MNTIKHPVFELMLEDMESAPHHFQPTSFWKIPFNQLCHGIRCFVDGIEPFRSWWISTAYFAPVYGMDCHNKSKEAITKILSIAKSSEFHPSTYKKFEEVISGHYDAVADYRIYRSTAKNYPPFCEDFSESTVGMPIEQFEFDGQKYSRSSLNYLRGLNFLKHNAQTERIKNVIEIGGGFGSLGEILLNDTHSDYFYVNVDLPPLAYLSTYYLQEIFGKKSIADYSITRDMDEIDITKLRKHYRGMVICPWQLERIKGEFQLAVNFISFQEMELSVVQNYLRILNPLVSDYFLMRNLSEGKQIKSETNSIGVEIPILRENYIAMMKEYELLNYDADIFGKKYSDGFTSEILLFKK